MALWIPWKLLIFVFMIVLPKLTWTTPSVSFSLIIPRMTFYHHHLVGAVIRSLRTYKPRLSNSINLQGKLRSLKTPSPKEILKIFCEGIFKENTNVILHINNPALLGRQMASTEYILQLSHSIGIPLISWNPDFSFVASRVPNDSLVLQIAPSVFHQCEAMMDLLDRYNWTDFTIIATTSEGHQDFILSLRKLAAEKSRSFSNLPEKGKSIDYEKKFRIIREILIQNKTTESIYQHLSTLVDTETRVILLYATRRDTLDIMEMAAELKLTEPKYIWIVTEISLVARSSSRPPRALPTGLLGISYNSSIDTMKIVISQAIDIWTRALQAISRHPQLMANITLQPNMSCDGAGSLHWDDGKVLYRFMKNVTIRGEGGQMNQFKADHSLKYVELKILNLNQEREWKEVGKWNQNGLTMYDITWPGNSPTPPKGRPEKFFMRVVTLDEIPYVRYLDVNELGKCGHNSVPCRVKKDIIQPNGDRIVTNETINKCCTGLCIDILKILSKRIGFDYDLFEVEDKIWGSKQPDGQWNGLVRSVLDGKADMVMTSTKITPERNKAIDFSLPFLETGITIIVAIREGAVSPTAFLEPYDYPAWCLILVFSVHATGASIFIFEWLSPFGLHQGKTPIREHKFSLFRSFWLIWAMLFGASVNTDNPRGVSSRFLANVWALFALVFLASYTANLAAFMITKEEFYDLSGIQDWRLMNPYALKPPFRFATVPNGSTETNLNKNYPKMYQYMQQFNKRNVKEGVESLKKNSIDAFIYDATVLEYRAGQDDMCKLRTVGKWYAMTGYGVAFPRGSKWINQVNQILLELQHNGEMERLQKFWLAGACKKQDQTGESSHSLGILNFTSAFILLAGGMVLGSLLLALEHLYFKFGRKSLQKWDKCGCCGLVSLSMGKSLTFEQSVREAIEQRKRHRCKDPICETQLWKARHELDLALLKIDKLQDQITTIGLTPEPGAVWKLQSVYQPLVREPPKMIKCKTEPSTPEKENPEPEGRDKAEVTPPSSAPEWRKNPPVDKQAFRRSPSYTTAMAVSDDPKQTGKTRYHNGNYYVEVDNMEIESVL